MQKKGRKMNTLYTLMTKRRNIDFGQYFTPEHIAHFAVKLLDIKEGDVVLDSSAGSGALLFAAIEAGCIEVYGIENDGEVFRLLRKNLEQVDDLKYEVICQDTRNEKVSEWIKSKPVTKCILNPPYEKKHGTYEILLNTLDALPAGTKTALFFPDSHFEKMTKAEKKRMAGHRIEKIIKLPKNTFRPFASVETSLFLITAGEPQGNHKPWGCHIPDDGLTRKKDKYRIDREGKWENELEPYWYQVITTGKGDDSVVEELEGLRYSKPRNPEDLIPTKDDFKRVVEDYLSFKIGEALKK